MTQPASWVLTLRQTLPARLRAAGIHLGISAVIFLAALYLILAQWYPGFHFAVDGGWRGVRIMAGVDLVLGPTLTLIIFNPLKARRLIAFDLACIGVTQLAALVWGFYAIHSQRPVLVSFYQGAFLSATEEPLKVEKYDLAGLKMLSDRHPALVFTAEPANDEEVTRAAMQELIGKVPLHADPHFFRRFEEHWPAVKAQALDPAQRSKERSAFAAELPEFLAARKAQTADFLYFPYEGRDGSCTLAFTPAGALVDALGCASY
jgi:hypothetical protein